jgi:hypothetical protein
MLVPLGQAADSGLKFIYPDMLPATRNMNLLVIFANFSSNKNISI